MSAKVYCFASPKGGSGKTILTASIASFLSELGNKCLIIDCDAATHGMTLLYLDEIANNKSDSKKGLFNSWQAEETNLISLMESLVLVENGIFLLPATYTFTPGFDPEKGFSDNILKDVVNIARDEFDVILLDAQAGSDKYSALAMNRDISDEVVIVSEYDPLSAAGVERLKRVIGEDLDYTRTWVLLNKMLPEFVEKFSEFLSITKYLPPIAWNADVVRAYAKGRLALNLEKGNVFTLSIIKTVSALVNEKTNEEIKKWLQKKEYVLREPIAKQLAHTEETLKNLHLMSSQLEYKYHKLEGYKNINGGVIPLGIAGFGATFFTISQSSIWTIDDTDMLTIMAVLTVLGIASLIIMMFVVIPKRRSSLNEVIGEKQILRQKIKFSEEKWKQLEALNAADLETIIKETQS